MERHGTNYPASRGFFLVSLLECMKLFASLVFRVVGLFTSAREVSLGEVNKTTTRNTRDMNDFVHAKRQVPEGILFKQGRHKWVSKRNKILYTAFSWSKKEATSE